jgi:glycerol uptake facilitator-like aquaporin
MRPRDALFAEFLGTLLLLLVTVGSELAARRLGGGDEFRILLVNALATGFGISALILALNPVSGACFNPLVAVLLCSQGELKWKHLPFYFVAQFGGAILGMLLCHYLFGLPVLEIASKPRPGPPLLASEFIGAIGLLLVVHRVGNTRSQAVAYAVGAYLLAATWALPSTCLANPALTLARMFTQTYAGIRPADAAGFMAAQVLALAVFIGFLRIHKRLAVLGE